MKQPELGKKVSELRKEKRLTQEELVEKCNVSIRTIQRIETGEVTPRYYTVRTIFEALDYTLDDGAVQDKTNGNRVTSWFKNLFLLGRDLSQPSDFLVKQLNIAWIFGVCYFILGFVESAADYALYKEGEMLFGATAFIVLKLALLASLIYFQRGLIIIGGLYDNYLLRVAALILIAANVLFIGHDIAALFYDSPDPEFVLVPASILFGGIGIIYGVSLLKLQLSIGDISKIAGILELISGVFLLTVVLFFIGFMFQIPAELFEIIIVYKVTAMYESGGQ